MVNMKNYNPELRDIEIKIEKNNYTFVGVLGYDETSNEYICFNVSNLGLYTKRRGDWSPGIDALVISKKTEGIVIVDTERKEVNFTENVEKISIPIMRRESDKLKKYQIGYLKALLYWVQHKFIEKDPPPLHIWRGVLISKGTYSSTLTKAVKLKGMYPKVFGQIMNDKPQYLNSRKYCRAINMEYKNGLSRNHIKAMIILSRE